MNTTIKCLCLITISLVSNLVYAQKKLYIPKDLQGMNLKADTSKWSLNRSIETDDLIFMWEQGFGNDVSNPPQLKGHDLSFNLLNLRDRIQTFYHFFRDTLGFVTPHYQSKADQYKMMVMVNYSLDGTAYGGTYDNFIGALHRSALGGTQPHTGHKDELHGPRVGALFPGTDNGRQHWSVLGRYRIFRNGITMDALAG